MDLRDLGEFGLIKRIRKWTASPNPALVQGIGDDVAIMEIGNKALLATTDILIEGIHFDRSWIDPYRLGRKSLMVNLSDIAAMGGTPKYFLVSLGLPKHLSLSYISRFYRGIQEGAKRYRVDLVGGDTSLAEKMTISICLLGEGRTKDLIFRRGARVGDDLFVSGTLGDSALGLRILQGKKLRATSHRLVEKHLSPCPRVELGKALADHRCATAMIDVSDGLLGDTHHLLEESGVGAMVWEERIPLSRSYRAIIPLDSVDPYQTALSGGEDYELLFTASPRKRETISTLSRALRIPITRIGKILPRNEKLRIVRKNGRVDLPSRLGFDHFG